jgi:signal transduction histidine kinase
MGSVVCPILTPETEPKDTQSTGHRYPALGVIRCSGLKSNYGTERGTINSIGRQTLGLIAQQVGPFIEMLSARIEREEKISCLKHDLFAPLNLIAHTTDRLETDSFLPIAKDRKVKFYDLMNIKSATMLARTMLPQLSLDPGDMTIAPTLVSIENDIIRYLKQMLSHVARIENGMAIKFDPLHAIPELYLDKLSIQRVVFNVIQNAIKYGDQGSVISISARHMPNDYRLSISNYGIGIHQQDEELIFEIGFRSSKAKTHCQGTGNGLYVAQKAMRLHRGHIELKKRAEPTIFDLVFPSLLRTNDWWRRD